MVVVPAFVVVGPAAFVVAAPATVVAVAAFVVDGAAVDTLHAPAGMVITSPGWMTWLIPSAHPLAATSVSMETQYFLAMANSESPAATVYCPVPAVVDGGAVLAPPAVVAAAPPAAVVAVAALVVAPAAVVTAAVLGTLTAELGVLGVVFFGSSEPHAASNPTPITTDTSDAYIRRRPVEVHPFTSSIVRQYRASTSRVWLHALLCRASRHNGVVDEARLRELIDGLRAGSVTPDEVVAEVRRLPFAEVGDALVDHHRHLRQGMPEAVYGRGKSPEQCVAIVGELLEHGDGPVLLTRVDDAQRKAVQAIHPGAVERGGCLLWRAPDVVPASEPGGRRVLVVSAGTSDVPVVDECLITLAAHGIEADRLVDVGVAGIHRLLAHLDRVTAAAAVVVVAGMEGALASVIGGLTSAPVVAVPTSVGYGSRARRHHRAPGDARLVRQRRHRGRHRQRLRRSLRDRPDAPVNTCRWFAPRGSTASPAPPAT